MRTNSNNRSGSNNARGVGGITGNKTTLNKPLPYKPKAQQPGGATSGTSVYDRLYGGGNRNRSNNANKIIDEKKETPEDH
jgi:hypothetical protein